MRISDSLVEKLLKASGKVTEAQLKTLREQEKTEKKPLQDLAIKSGSVSEKELTKLYATEIDIPYIDLAPDDIESEVLKSIPERTAQQYRAVVFAVDKNGVKSLAIEDPDDIQAVSFLQKRLGTDLKVFIAPASQIQAALDQYRGNFAGEITKVASEGNDDLADEEVSEDEVAEDSPIAQTVNLIIEYGVKSGASDIHIEPRENHVVIRYRIDGILREANKLPRKVLAALVSRIKILSNLKIDEHRAPQDGRFKVQFGGHVFALRVSTLPIVDGEKVVMRILNESSKPATLQELGYWGISLKNIQNAITQPHGMILVTGPTGSGKSTSLFSALSILNSPSVNISTVEDPIEYKIVGANQTQVNPQAGMTFTSGLRALLRQDPNIIMVGEIRDGETASLGVQAALTGHLVFSTLHTNNAATCLPRLLDMGIEPFLIASTMRVVVGQRLLRRLCPQCREDYAPDKSVLDDITRVFHITDSASMKRIHALEQQALDEGIGIHETKSKQSAKGPQDLATTETSIKRLWRAHEDGCDACNHTGYKGRVGIYEVLSNSEKIQNLIINNATSEAIQEAAIADDMITMQVDGFIKALRGETTLEEIMRVTAEN
jgi:type IV pilus assembly protein PilB